MSFGYTPESFGLTIVIIMLGGVTLPLVNPTGIGAPPTTWVASPNARRFAPAAIIAAAVAWAWFTTGAQRRSL
ncbi:MAG: hypothetical protein ABI868_19685 [Acidobacteriota bacterium]